MQRLDDLADRMGRQENKETKRRKFKKKPSQPMEIMSEASVTTHAVSSDSSITSEDEEKEIEKKRAIAAGKLLSKNKAKSLFAGIGPRLCGYNGIRVGEATNPGPAFSGRTVYVTSLTPHLPYIASFDVDFMTLQEVRLTIDGQKIIDEGLNPNGRRAIWVKDQPIRSGTTKSVTDAKQGGVGILVHKRHQAAPSLRTEVGEKLYNTGRWQSCVIKLNGSSSLIHVVTVYGFLGANDGGDDMKNNEDLLPEIFLETASLGDVPIIVGGDFNVRFENSPTLSELVAEGFWNDAASLYATATGTPIQDTYQISMGSSRIDMLLMNAAATRRFKHCCVVEVPPEGIKRHKPVEGRWSCDLAREFATQIRPIRGLPKKQTKIDPDENDFIIEESIMKEVDTFYNAFLDDDVDSMWDCWSKMAESYLVTKAAIDAGQLNIVRDARYYGRGKIQEKRTRVLLILPNCG